MAKAAIIVESPTKTRTLKRFLGDEFELLASMGHVRDLPEDELAVDVEHGFQPSYTVTPRQRKVLAALKKALAKVDRVLLASDPDREGEAIAWHLVEALNLRNAERIEFNEITEQAVREALNHPRPINMDRVNAQQARRVLDRLVGYMLSPLLWDKLGRRGGSSLSAGRVQSAALKLICDREREINAFVPDEYWTITATLSPIDRDTPFEAELKTRDGQDLELKTAQQAEPIAEELRHLPYRVESVERKERRRNPQPPFITSTLQRAAANALGFSARKTMMVAQQLYQGVELPEGSVGLITYMRTDSTRVAQEARDQALSFIERVHGKNYLGPGVAGKKAKGAQEAHEAIRPTSVERTPESLRPHLDEDQFKLYDLIWRRFVASQMAAAVYDQTTVQVQAGPYGLRASGSVLKFPGFLTVMAVEEDGEEKALPELHEGEDLRVLSVSADQHFTKPPPRYTEATLVKELEENGVGRPSTYAQIIETLRQRKYVRMEKRQFVPTVLGFTVNDYLVEHFPETVDVEFTARIEEALDRVEQGEQEWVQLVSEFYAPFSQTLQQAQKARPKPLEGERCPECGGQLLEMYSVYGKFAGCENFPQCKYKRDLTQALVPRPKPQPAGENCPECGKPLLIRSSQRGQFLGCSGYPACKYTRDLSGDQEPRPQAEPVGETCPECGKPLVLRQSRRGPFIGCSGYPKCKYIRSEKGERRAKPKAVETDIICDECGRKMLVRIGRRGAFLGCSGYPRCRNTRNLTDEERQRWLPEGAQSSSGESDQAQTAEGDQEAA